MKSIIKGVQVPKAKLIPSFINVVTTTNVITNQMQRITLILCKGIYNGKFNMHHLFVLNNENGNMSILACELPKKECKKIEENFIKKVKI